MKVLLISSIDFPVSRNLKHGATQRVVYYLATELQRLGVEVTVCCPGDSDELDGARFATVRQALASPPERPNANIYTDPEEHELHFELSLELALSQGFDLVHEHHTKLLLSDTYLRYRSLLRMPVLTTLHGAVTADRHLEECETYKDRATSNVFFNCVSRHQAHLYQQHMDISGVVHNGIFVEDYHLQQQKKDFLFSLGRIMWRKGQDLAVDVAERTGLKLVLAGPIMEPEYFEQFRSRVRMMPEIGTFPVTPSYVEDVVDPVLACQEPAIYIGELDDARKDIWFGQARCFLMPVRWDEPFGLVLAESMLCGTPVIAFKRGGIPEIVIDGKTGFLVSSADEMVEAVARVGQIDPLECRRHVEKHFSSEVMGQRYLELYERLVSQSADAEAGIAGTGNPLLHATAEN